MKCILVLGGARSGKSRFAEAIITQHSDPWRYIATGRAYDDEMQRRIDAHKAARVPGWETIEAPLELSEALACPHPVLIDCLTLWLSHLLMASRDVAHETELLLAALRRRDAPTVLVGSEVGYGIVPENALARRFRDEAGLLHQCLGREAERIYLVVAGYAVTVK